MRKRTLEKLTVGGFGLCVLGFIITMLTAVGSTGVTGLVAGVLFGYLILMGGFVLQTVGWVGVLIAQAKRQQWGWFVCTILRGLFGLWLYLLIVPETPEPGPARPVAFLYPPMQGYLPDQPYAPMLGYAPGQPSIPASYAFPGQPSQSSQSQPAPSEQFEQPQE